jgi:hypothetical protein
MHSHRGCTHATHARREVVVCRMCVLCGVHVCVPLCRRQSIPAAAGLLARGTAPVRSRAEQSTEANEQTERAVNGGCMRAHGPERFLVSVPPIGSPLSASVAPHCSACAVPLGKSARRSKRQRKHRRSTSGNAVHLHHRALFHLPRLCFAPCATANCDCAAADSAAGAAVR